MNMCLIGGGPSDEILRQSLEYADSASVLLIPGACSTPRSYARKVGSNQERFKAIGARAYPLHDFGQDPSPEALDYMFESNDMVYVIGGHTPSLKQNLQELNIKQRLLNFLERGGLYSGASAGALAVFSEAMICPAKNPKEETWEYEKISMMGIVNAFATAHANGIDGFNSQTRRHFFERMIPLVASPTSIAIENGAGLMIVEDCSMKIQNNPGSGNVQVYRSVTPGVVDEVISLEPDTWCPNEDLGFLLKAS